MKKIIFLALVLTIIVFGVVQGAAAAAEDKPAYVTYSYFTYNFEGIDSPHKVISTFQGRHYLVYSLILNEGEHNLYLELRDTEGDLFQTIELDEENQVDGLKSGNLYSATFACKFDDSPRSEAYFYFLFDIYNGEKYLIDNLVVLPDGI